jgi:hypothetical protein
MGKYLERRHKLESHGMTNTYLYRLWSGMLRRCYNPNQRGYPDYGGRGIIVCDRWKKSFVAFYKDMGHRPTDKHSIDRIDCNGNYEPSNCRWATLEIQLSNRRKNKAGLKIQYKGEILNLTDASRKFGIPYTTLRGRIEWGWDPIKAIETPSNVVKKGRRLKNGASKCFYLAVK